MKKIDLKICDIIPSIGHSEQKRLFYEQIMKIRYPFNFSDEPICEQDNNKISDQPSGQAGEHRKLWSAWNEWYMLVIHFYERKATPEERTEQVH